MIRSPPMQGEVPSTRVVVSDKDIETMHAIERFILSYSGDNLLHDVDLFFPRASYRAFFLALGRTQNPARWLQPEGRA